MTVLDVNKVIRKIGKIELLIKEIKKIRPHFSDEEIFELILKILK